MPQPDNYRGRLKALLPNRRRKAATAPVSAAQVRCPSSALDILQVVCLCRQPVSALHAASWWSACWSLPMLLCCHQGGPRSVHAACQPAGSMQVGSASASLHASLPHLHSSFLKSSRSGLCSWSSALVTVACYPAARDAPVCTGHLPVPSNKRLKIPSYCCFAPVLATAAAFTAHARALGSRLVGEKHLLAVMPTCAQLHVQVLTLPSCLPECWL